MPKIRIEGENQTFDLNEGEVIYDGLLERDLKLPHGCLSGSCGACKIEVLQGEENLKPPSAVEEDTINSLKQELDKPAAKIRLACRAKVTGDIFFRKI